MLRFLSQRPIAVLTTFSGLVLLGFIVLQQLPISLLPPVPIPQISVQIIYPNKAARTLENTVVRPLRNQLLQVGNLKDIKSQSRNSIATILLEFDFGTNTNLAFIEVNEKIDQIMGRLPEDLPRPLVLKANSADIPVFHLSIYPKDQQGQHPLELAQFSQSVIKRRIEQLPQVAFVDRSGFALPEVKIIPQQDLLQSLNIRASDLSNILQQNNIELGSVLIQDGQYQYNIRFQSTLKSVDDIANIYFNHKGRVFQLKDIAQIQLQTQERRGKYLYDGEEAIVLTIRKQADAQLFVLKKEFAALVKAFEADYPELNFKISNDQSQLLELSISNLQSSLAYGAIFAFLILFLFFREWQAPILIGLIIPSTLAVAILFFYLFNLSINIISLSGLILGVGLMIDNSIIIIENIRQYRIMGYAVSDACVQGANEVIRPLISSALTTCSVFLPLIFLSGIGGALFYDQALSISIALGTSLGIAYILLPTLLRLISSKNSKGIIAASSPSFYKKSVNGVLQYPWLTLILFIGLVGGLFAQLPKLKQETFPELTRNALTVAIDWNEAINLSTNEQRNLDLIKHLDTLVTKYSLDLGEHQFLLNAAQRDINESNAVLYTNQSIEKLQVEIQQYFLTYYPQASIQLAPLKNIFDELFNASEPNLIMLIQSASSQQVPALATAQPIFDYLDQNAFFYAIPPQEIVYNLQIRKEKALLFQVDYETIYHQLKTLFNQNQVSMLRTSEAFIPIIISQEEGNLYELMQSARVYNQQGDLLPLSNFIQIQQQTAYKTINAGKTGEALSIALDTVSQPLMEELKKHTAQNTNLALSFTGAFFEQQQYLRELSIILGIVLVLLYLILAAQFESLMLPFIVLLTVPIGISGAIGLLYFMNETINLIAIIGMIVLSGIVVNDAILKIDKMEKERRNHSLKEAIHIGGQRRLKPILMTTLTTILALIPILFSDGLGAELQGPLAFTLIGGLILGTIASLYFIPVLYFLLRKKYLPKYRLPNEIY